MTYRPQQIFGLTFRQIMLVLAMFCLPFTVQANYRHFCSAVQTVPYQECHVLTELYSIKYEYRPYLLPEKEDEYDWEYLDRYWQNKELTDPCTWGGVTCSDGHVTALGFCPDTFYSETRPLPPELGLLEKLQHLNLEGGYGMGFTGSIPPELGNLRALETLDLSNNTLEGQIPPELGNLAALQTLNLANSSLTGPIPESLWNLTALQSLNMEGNLLTGTLSPRIGNLRNLVSLYLSDNDLQGEIPPEIGNLINLQLLHLKNLNLEGEIPPELGKLSNLTSLTIEHVPLSGHLPKEIGNLEHLEHLTITGTQISGSLPPEFCNLSNLQTFIGQYNQFEGELPSGLGKLTQMFVFNIVGNQFSGPLPEELGNLNNCMLYLTDNRFTGALPRSFLNIEDWPILLHQNDVCAPSDPEFLQWFYGLELFYRAGIPLCELLLTLDPSSGIPAQQIFEVLDASNINYTPIFNHQRGNLALKEQLGLQHTYVLEAPQTRDLEQLRQELAFSTEGVESCLHNQLLNFDSFPGTTSSARIPWNLIPLPDHPGWQVDRDTARSTVAIIDNFESLRPIEAASTSSPTGGLPQSQPSTHGLQVASLADTGDQNLLLLDVGQKASLGAKLDDVLKTLEYAVDSAYDVRRAGAAGVQPDMLINMSLSVPVTEMGETEEERQAVVALFQRWIEYAGRSHVAVITSMGNLNWDVPHYPAAFPDVIAVGGTSTDNNRWISWYGDSGSNYGEHLDLVAPIGPYGGYTYRGLASGTSLSAPRVTAAAAQVYDILAARYPGASTEYLSTEMQWLLDITALDRIGDPAEDVPGRDRYYGQGLLDADAAIACAEREQILARPGELDFGPVKNGETHEMPLRLTNCYRTRTVSIDADSVRMVPSLPATHNDFGS